MSRVRPKSLYRFALAAALLAACVGLRAQSPAPSLDGAAKLISFTGQISVMRDSTPWALNVGDLVQPQQVIVTGPDGWGVFQVADGSKFEVFQNARVAFRANRSNWTDLLEVWLGKVRVQIEHFGNLPNHNQVRTPSAVISVRGTIFDVEVEDVNETTLVLDEEGSVEVRHLLRPDSKSRILTPGEWVRVYKNEPLGKAVIDKGGILQRGIRILSEAGYQIAANASRGAAGVPRGTTAPATTSPGDHNTNTPPPPPPPPPPSAPPPPPM